MLFFVRMWGSQVESQFSRIILLALSSLFGNLRATVKESFIFYSLTLSFFTVHINAFSSCFYPKQLTIVEHGQFVTEPEMFAEYNASFLERN